MTIGPIGARLGCFKPKKINSFRDIVSFGNPVHCNEKMLSTVSSLFPNFMDLRNESDLWRNYLHAVSCKYCKVRETRESTRCYTYFMVEKYFFSFFLRVYIMNIVKNVNHCQFSKLSLAFNTTTFHRYMVNNFASKLVSKQS